MSDYTLVHSGSISVTSADVGTMKDVNLPAPIKLTSAIIVAQIRDRRRDVSVQRGTVLVGNGGTSPQDVVLTAVDRDCSHVSITVRENRDGNARGVTAVVTSSTNLRLEFYGTVDAGENIEVQWQVIEHKSYRGATLKFVDNDTIRLTWAPAQLAAGETIDVDYFVYDIENVGDDLKELLYRAARTLAAQGENTIQDLVTYDDVGNPTTFRVRQFDSQANAEAATVNLAEGGAMQTGELDRFKVTVAWNTSKNRPTSIISVRTHLVATPGVN